MKTKEELNALKEEVETMNKKLAELTEEELAQVAGGAGFIIPEYDPHYVPERYFDTDPKDEKFKSSVHFTIGHIKNIKE